MDTLKTVTIRDLRNRGGEILAEVARGEAVIVTRDGEPIAEIRPLPPRGLTTDELLARWRHLPPIDPVQFRADVDSIVDQSI
jgi:prevent-host-death family protein